jgi:hypothetical protein
MISTDSALLNVVSKLQKFRFRKFIKTAVTAQPADSGILSVLTGEYHGPAIDPPPGLQEPVNRPDQPAKDIAHDKNH